MTLSAPLREYVSIVFSEDLVRAAYGAKQDALIKLAEFIEESPHIQTYCVQGNHVIEEVYPFFTEKFDLSQTFRWEVLGRELTHHECVRVQMLGFDTYTKEGLVIEG
jgi:hypothetical protein